uniref:Proline rich transmembrane protein 4a n=1 Tax=Cyprinodon variegatus TaxID=28743 RepID=A0A3Q2CSS1_CYPVA
MGSLWNIYLLLTLSLPLSLHGAAITEEHAKERREIDNDKARRFLTEPPEKSRQSSISPDKFMFEPENLDFPTHPLSWPSSSSEDLDRQGVIGEYSDFQGAIEESVYHSSDGVLTSRPSDPLSEDTNLMESVQTSSSAVEKATNILLLEGNMDISTTPCKTSDQSWTPTYPEDFAPSEPLLPSLALSPAMLVPLYSDWNSAFATWGFAWEAHIYCMGSAFTLICLISVVCLLGLPLRCPPGVGFFMMLHIFILAFAGIQGFILLYDAYNAQDRLPTLVTQLLSELPMPCLIAAFSLAFFLLSLHTRTLPKPSLLLCICLLQFTISLGWVGLFQLFHSLPTVIILIPQGLFVLLIIFLSFSYLIFYCLKQGNTKQIYRLSDNGENGSPEVVRPVRCPFSKVEDWDRAAGAGIGSSLCLLGCGGFQLYGILHALGFGGVVGFGFQPWPWWGYHVGCRCCEIGVCLGLSIIGTYPVFCNTSSSLKTISNPRPGSWSRLSCSSPLQENGGASLEEANSLQSETLALCSVIDNPTNDVGCADNYSLSHSTLPLHTPQNPPEGTDSDSTGDLRPPSPIDLSRSIDQALFSESLFSHITLNQGPKCVGDTLYRASSCGDVDQENAKSCTRACQPHASLLSHRKTPIPRDQIDWKGSISGSTHGLCNYSKQTGKLRSNSWTNRGQSNFPRAIPSLSYHRRYRTLSMASQDSQASGRIAGTKQLSESKQLEWDMTVQAEFVNVCKQIDALSMCSDTIEL